MIRPGMKFQLVLFYQNELAYQYLNSTKVPGVPHVILLKRSYSDDNQYNVPVASKTDILVDLVGGNAINKWIKDGFPIPKGAFTKWCIISERALNYNVLLLTVGPMYIG